MKNIVLTGTSRGIGKEVALILADAGHNVLALSRHPNEELLNHPHITFLPTDLSREDGFEALETYLDEHRTMFDGIIHNAGALINRPFEMLRRADFEYVYSVNVFGVAELTRLLLPYLKPGSHVLSISSMGGVQGSSKFAGLAAYSSSKGALITLSELLAEEYKEQLIAFNVLALGAVQTEMLSEAFPGFEAPTSAGDMGRYIADFALNGHRFYNGKILPVAVSTP